MKLFSCGVDRRNSYRIAREGTAILKYSCMTSSYSKFSKFVQSVKSLYVQSDVKHFVQFCPIM